MKQLIIEGTVVDIRPIVTGTRADGTPWASQTYALQVDDGDGYTRLIAFDLYDETRIRQWNIQPGEHLAVAVTLSSTAAREGGYFTRLRAYKIMRGYEAINGLMALLGAQPQAPGTLAYGGTQTIGTPTYPTAAQPADLAQGLALLARLATAKGNANAKPTPASPAPAATPNASPTPPATPNASPTPAATPTLPGMTPPPRRDTEDDLPF